MKSFRWLEFAEGYRLGGKLKPDAADQTNSLHLLLAYPIQRDGTIVLNKKSTNQDSLQVWRKE